MINLLELLGGPGRFILGLGPPPWGAPVRDDDRASADPSSGRGVKPSGGESVERSGGSTSSTTGPSRAGSRRDEGASNS